MSAASSAVPSTTGFSLLVSGASAGVTVTAPLSEGAGVPGSAASTAAAAPGSALSSGETSCAAIGSTGAGFSPPRTVSPSSRHASIPPR